jgi:hypothetical protein
MHFLAPSAFWGFFAMAAVPLILYLLFRRKKRDVPWAATYILKRTLKSQSKVNIWKQYIIIFIRTLSFIVLPFAFLMPFLDWAPSESGAFPTAPASTHRMILLDMSESMAASHGSGRRMDAALSLCRKILDAGAFRGRVDILSLNSPDKPLVFEEFPIPDLEMEELLGTLTLSKQMVDFERGLRTALSEFRASHFSKKELFILSDFSGRDLLGLEDYLGLMEALQKQDVKLFSLSYENPSADNFALLDMTPAMDLLLAGRPTLFYIRVGYYGKKATADTWLSIRTQKGKVLYEEAVNLAPGEKTLEIPLALGGKEQTLVAQLGEDDFPLDNQIERSYRVSDKLSLVVVQALNLAKGFENPRKWLEFALEGNAKAGHNKSIFNLKHIRDRMAQGVVGGSEIMEKAVGDSPENGAGYRTVLKTVIAAQMSPALLRGMDGILLLDVDTTTDESIAAFKKYMIRGGTVLLGPGPTAKPDKFNKAFVALTPAMIGPPVTKEIDPEIYSGAVLEYMQHPLFRELEAIQHGNMGNARFYNHYQIVEDSLVEDAEILFSLSDGAPLLLRKRVGRGACLLWTAGLGGDWHSMVVHPAYPVFFSRLFNLAASARQFALNLAPGELIVREVDQAKVHLRLPAGNIEILPASEIGGKQFVRYDQTTAPGTYTLLPDPEDENYQFHYHVAEDRRESDYRAVSGDRRAELERQLGSALHLKEAKLAQAIGAGYEGKAFAPTAAVVLFFLLLLEAGLLRKWFA